VCNCGRRPTPGKVIALKNIRLLVCAFSRFWMLIICVYRISMVTGVSNVVHKAVWSPRSSFTASYSSSEPLSALSS
jgi:hypothetical protein